MNFSQLDGLEISDLSCIKFEAALDASAEKLLAHAELKVTRLGLISNLYAQIY